MLFQRARWNSSLFWSPVTWGIFIYNICLITIPDTICDQATRILVPNIQRARHD